MFEVTWRDAALDDLADAWVRADVGTRDVLEAAVNSLNARLAADPTEEGESRPDGRRITFEMPAVVIFRVNVQARTVRVTHFWTYPKAD